MGGCAVPARLPAGPGGCWNACSPGATPARPARPTVRCGTPSTCRPGPDAPSTGRRWVPPDGARGLRRARRAAALEPPGAGRRAWRTPAGTSWWRPARRRASRWPTSCRCCAAPSPRTARRHRPLPLAHQGAGRGPAAGARGARPPDVRAAALRRRHPARRAGLGPPARPVACSATPTCCTAPCCRGTRRWAEFLRRLRYVVVDECHTYRGRVRRARGARCCAGCCGSARGTAPRPTFVLASATVARPGGVRDRLDRAGVVAVTDDGSPARRAARRAVGAAAARRADRRERRPGAAGRGRGVGADLLADLSSRVSARWPSSGRGAGPSRSRSARSGLLAEVDPALAARVARLPGRLPARGAAGARGAPCVRGDLLGLAATNALELGIDIAGLDAVVWPASPAPGPPSGSRPAAPAGSATRRSACSSPATTRSTPTSSTIPTRCSAAPVEGCVLDPANPYVLAPHLPAPRPSCR